MFGSVSTTTDWLFPCVKLTLTPLETEIPVNLPTFRTCVAPLELIFSEITELMGADFSASFTKLLISSMEIFPSSIIKTWFPSELMLSKRLSRIPFAASEERNFILLSLLFTVISSSYFMFLIEAEISDCNFKKPFADFCSSVPDFALELGFSTIRIFKPLILLSKGLICESSASSMFSLLSILNIGLAILMEVTPSASWYFSKS